MYINPFLAGVICTIGFEIGALFVAACIAAFKRVKRGNKYGDFR
jgi:ABC-type arginine transport system permease subunit